jgi:alpha-D-xyloside xylohydrolase
MDFPQDTAVNNIGDQFLLGPSLLVNPVYSFGAHDRDLYLPAGKGWYELYSGKYIRGGQHIRADAPFEKIPVFVKEGSIIPFGPDLQYTGEKAADPITLFVYTGSNADFTLYEDEGNNYDYEQGLYSNIPISYDESAGRLTIGARQGSFPGMLKERTFRVVWITKDRPAPLQFDQTAAAELHYTGERISTSFSSRIIYHSNQ